MKENVKEFIATYTSKDVVRDINAAVELQILYKSAFNKNIDCLTCDSKLIRAYNELEQYSLTNIIHTMAENFKLIPGVHIHLHVTNEVIHDGNLESDEQAIQLLSQNKKLIAAFESYPADWEKKVDSLLKSGKSDVEKNEVNTGEPVKEKKKK